MPVRPAPHWSPPPSLPPWAERAAFCSNKAPVAALATVQVLGGPCSVQGSCISLMCPSCHRGRRGRRRIMPRSLWFLLTSYGPGRGRGLHSRPVHLEGRRSPPPAHPLDPSSPGSKHTRVPDGGQPALPPEACSVGYRPRAGVTGWARTLTSLSFQGKEAAPNCSPRHQHLVPFRIARWAWLCLRAGMGFPIASPKSCHQMPWVLGLVSRLFPGA